MGTHINCQKLLHKVVLKEPHPFFFHIQPLIIGKMLDTLGNFHDEPPF